MDAECPFCTLPEERIWLETDRVVAVPDYYPATDGHCLVLPRVHIASLWDLSPEEHAEVWDLVAEVRDLLVERHSPDGFTIGVNDGLAAGQTIPHAHVHVIPRHLGDVSDPPGGLRGILPHNARYWES